MTTQCTLPEVTTKRADEIQAGDQVAERDGYLLEVTQVARMPRGQVVIYLRDPMGYRSGTMMHKPVRPSTMIRVAAVEVA